MLENLKPAKELGNYKGWKIEILTDDNSAKILFVASFQKSPQKGVFQLHSDNLENLKRKIDHIKLRKGAYIYGRENFNNFNR